MPSKPVGTGLDAQGVVGRVDDARVHVGVGAAVDVDAIAVRSVEGAVGRVPATQTSGAQTMADGRIDPRGLSGRQDNPEGCWLLLALSLSPEVDALDSDLVGELKVQRPIPRPVHGEVGEPYAPALNDVQHPPVHTNISAAAI